MRTKLAAILMVALLWGCQTQPTPPATESASTHPPDALPPNALPSDHQTSANPAQSAGTTPPPAADPVVATIRGEDITLHQLEKPLIEAYGMNIMLELVQLDLVEQEARKNGLTYSEQDVEDETTRTLIEFREATDQVAGTATVGASTTQPSTQPSDETLSPVERERELTLLLSSQHLNRTEFSLAMRRNAILRKIVAPTAEAALTDDALHERFNAIYGEKAQVRFIRLPDMASVAAVERDISAGKTFEEEVALHAYDSVGRSSSGELAPFSRKDVNYPTEFKMVAFGLKPGQMSDPVQITDSIYLVKLLELIPPQHANFDDYKDSVRKDLYELNIQGGITKYIDDLSGVARASLEVKNPILKAQWEQSLRNADELRKPLKPAAAATQPAAAGASNAPADAPAATTVPAAAN